MRYRSLVSKALFSTLLYLVIAFFVAALSVPQESIALEKIRAKPLKAVSGASKTKPTPTPPPELAEVNPELAAATPIAAPTPQPLPIWEGSAEASLATTTGNTTTRNIGASMNLIYRTPPWTHSLKANYLTSSSDGAVTSERGSVELRGGRDLTERSDLFADLIYLNNRFAGLDYQVIPEVGYGYEWILADALQFRTESALGSTFERRTDDTTTSYPTGRLGFLFAWKVNESAEFSHETSGFANLGDMKDWRLRSETSITSGVTKVIALKVSYIYEFYSRPVLDKAKDNSTLTSSLVLSF